MCRRQRAAQLKSVQGMSDRFAGQKKHGELLLKWDRPSWLQNISMSPAKNTNTAENDRPLTTASGFPAMRAKTLPSGYSSPSGLAAGCMPDCIVSRSMFNQCQTSFGKSSRPTPTLPNQDAIGKSACFSEPVSRFGNLHTVDGERNPCEMALELVSGSEFWCNRHCANNPIDLEGTSGPSLFGLRRFLFGFERGVEPNIIQTHQQTVDLGRPARTHMSKFPCHESEPDPITDPHCNIIAEVFFVIGAPSQCIRSGTTVSNSSILRPRRCGCLSEKLRPTADAWKPCQKKRNFVGSAPRCSQKRFGKTAAILLNSLCGNATSLTTLPSILSMSTPISSARKSLANTLDKLCEECSPLAVFATLSNDGCCKPSDRPWQQYSPKRWAEISPQQ